MDDKSKKALQAHDLYWSSYLNGRTDILASLLDENYLQIGSVEEEVFFNKMDAVGFVKSTIDQIAGKVEMRNRVTKSETLSGYILISEFCDLYVKTDAAWNFYAKFRASSLMQQKTDGWKLIHQHSSMPDSKTEEGQNIAIEKISKENLALKDAIKRRTAELENKNRELEIESALERVRSRSMAMHRSDELAEVASVVFGQLKKLGIQHLASGFVIFDHDKPAGNMWMSFQGDFHPTPLPVDFTVSPVLTPVYTSWKEGAPFYINLTSGEELSHHIQLLQKLFGDRIEDVLEKTRQLFISQGKEVPDQMVMHHTFFNHGSLVLNNIAAIEEQEILNRFANVFEQSYTRFLDLKKAEAQAREARIEAALEKVRSRSLAMHESQDLHGVVTLVHEQLESIGLFMNSVLLHELTYDSKSQHFWVAANGLVYPEQTEIPITRNAFFTRFKEAQENKESFFVQSLTKQQKDNFFRHYFGQSSHSDVPRDRKDYIFSCEGLNRSTALHKYTALTIMRYDKIAYSGEQNEVIKRFAQVFEQSYQRYLDLKKAEEQAREAQIEAALERVRASSMAMHKSEELVKVVRRINKEIMELEIKVDGTQIVTDFSNPEEGFNVWLAVEGMDYLKKFHIPNLDSPVISKLQTFKDGQNFYTEKYSKAERNRFFRLIYKYSDYKRVPKERQAVSLEAPGGWIRSTVINKNSTLAFQRYGSNEFSEEDNAILIRFGAVFEQAYTRFLDLQKAEEQAREAQIEAALERVRAQSMAMHKSEELVEVVRQLKKEIMELRIDIDVTQIVTDFTDDPHDGLNDWVAVEGQRYLEKFHIPFIDHPLTSTFYETLENDLGTFTATYSKSEKNAYFKLLFEHSDFKDIPEERKNFILEAPGWVNCVVIKNNSSMQFVRYNLKEFTQEEVQIFKRFGNVFGQVYTRFLDLQKAEEQAKESEIQLALERVRARTMAMQNSEELAETSAVLFEQMKILGITPERMNVCLVKEDSNELEIWSTDQDGVEINHQFSASFDEQTTGKKAYKAWKKGLRSATITLTGDELSEWVKYVREEMNMDIREESLKDQRIHSLATFSHGMLITTTNEPLPPDSIRLMERFAEVFNLTYTRFLDLQKAEAQAREAKIEAALERIRSRSMGMQSSDELVEASDVMFSELKKLEISTLRIGICTIDGKTGAAEIWSRSEIKGKAENRILGVVPSGSHPVFDNMVKAWKENKPFFSSERVGEEVRDYYDTLASCLSYPEQVEYNERETITAFFFPEGSLNVITLEPLKKEDCEIMVRFARVFGQMFRRFLDLQKAEDQAKEARIETALERVRSRSMGMQKSEDLRSVVDTLYGEFEQLYVDFHVAAIQLLPDDTMDLHLWLSTADGMYEDIVHWPYTDIPIFHHIYKSRKGDKMLEYTMGETETKEFFEEYFKLDFVPNERKNATNDVNVIDFVGAHQEHTGIFLMRYTEGSYSQHEKDIINRFSKVFEQTYTRFLDIQRAEKLALETARQSSLDRIRAEIASMRSAEDLNQITPIIWDELKTLEIPFIRCGVFIIDEENELSHTYLSTSQGDPIAALHLPMEDIPLVKNLRKSWTNQQIYSEHWDKQDFKEWTQNLIDRGFIDSKKKYEAGSAPETLDLHFLPFKHGMLYIGNTEPLPQEKLDLGQSMASAFSVAYDRYEDFNKLEQAKQKIEEAFKELEAAKDQLVQQEKLASLGQLTAGIAHEIKNPLNFVNNFSELSIELVEEAREEVKEKLSADSHQLTAVFDILDDIEANLKTIHKHGTRADSIVKSMLQHSRGGDGVMEPTSLNPIIKEYVNLAFHGMRAGKKPINVDIELDLDESVGDVPLIAEDFSRVILNLCNNAFDAMREKTLSPNPSPRGRGVPEGWGEGEYEPKLTVRTLRNDDTVSIEIQDNGPGIPDEIKEKILQPFFTTKKGTAGTGLGLSITNDIIKAHGGKLAIESKENEFTTFIIQLNK